MSDSLLVSVIIPCYKQAQYLSKALESVLLQTYSNWECIIVNDGSPDNTEEIALDWCKKDKRFRYLKKENGGLSSARNAGIRISKGINVLPLDADDMIEATFLSKASDILDNESQIGIVSSFVQFFGIKNNIISSAKSGGTELFIGHQNNNVACALFRKSIWEQINGYNENLKSGFEDWDFWLRATNCNWNVEIIPDPLYFYRIKDESMWVDAEKNKVNLMETLVKNNIDIYKKYVLEAIVDRERIIFELRNENKFLSNKFNKIRKLFPFKVYSFFKKSIRSIFSK